MKKILITLFSAIMMMTTIQAEENPFFLPFKGPHGTAPFQEIKISHYEPAFEKAMAEHRAEIDQITTNPEEPTFANTIEALGILEPCSTVGGCFSICSALKARRMMKSLRNHTRTFRA